MTDKKPEDWDPFSTSVVADQRAAYDNLRECCPVAFSKPFGWTLFHHEDIEHVLHDPDSFSNRVSRHLSVPNGMDVPEHTTYRQLIEPYFSREQVLALAPRCLDIARELAGTLLTCKNIEFISQFARPFAARVQCAFLGWPERMSGSLCEWTVKTQQAALVQDRQTLAATAQEFNGYVLEMLQDHRQGQAETGEGDVTARLLRECMNGKPLSDEELVSILRNWTVGEVGTLSAAIGILIHFLATDQELQQHLRNDPSRLMDANEEILRLHGPLVANRRVAMRTTEIGDRRIHAGELVQLNWIAANRDPRIFMQPDEFQLDRDQSRNLLWGSGIHICPGAPLARMEMRVAMEAILEQTLRIGLRADPPPVLARYPASGFESLHLKIV